MSKSFKALFTRGGANAGAVMEVLGPDGKKTEHWIRVRGVDSDEFQKAHALMRRRLMEYIEQHGTDIKKDEAYQEHLANLRREHQASLVMDWSFEEPCTKEAAIELFTNARYIAEQVDEFAGKRDRFVSTGQIACEPSQNNKLVSLPQQPTDQVLPSGSTTRKSRNPQAKSTAA